MVVFCWWCVGFFFSRCFTLIPLFQVFPIVSLVMLSLCYLPGVIAAFIQLYRGTKYKSEFKPERRCSLILRFSCKMCINFWKCLELTSACCRRFPNWLDRWMLCRKQMGLLALGFAFLHAIYTFIIPIRYAVRHKLISQVVDEVLPCTSQCFSRNVDKSNF